MIPRILAIAGSDSGGGAGIQADIKTITMLGGHAMTAITAITAQNSLGVQSVFAIPIEEIAAQVRAVSDDLGVDAVKIGMLATGEIVLAVRDMLRATNVPIVVDPVMVATSGAALNAEGTAAAMPALFEIATLITPNMPELAVLSGLPVEDEAGMAKAGQALAARHRCAILAKGGHMAGAEVVDLLIEADGAITRWSGSKIETRHSHGTGCTLSSAIATGLGAGRPLIDAVAAARDYVRAALLAAPGLGAGHGPMGHGLGRAYFPHPA
ncbi:bifunctional hydroxymethylpyrimidine kinase/phosphomethylpyrimidine kinase [Sphingomonas sp.]|uniref:bifunctional hydroxymethylpyrimidine kinase/phosphomethylpyrimidine kinase n=1 Tax=Sphingomonas sp. TaxID=28214 RepID=UPI003B3B8CAA